MRKADENEKEEVGRRPQILRALKALDDDDEGANLSARKALKRVLDEDDATAKKAKRAKRAEDDELDEDSDELGDDSETDEEDLGGAPRQAKRGKKAKKAKRADDDEELDDDSDSELDEDEEGKRAYSDDDLYRQTGMDKHERNSRQPYPQSMSGTELVRRAKQIALREGLSWRTLSGREDAFLMAAR